MSFEKRLKTYRNVKLEGWKDPAFILAEIKAEPENIYLLEFHWIDGLDNDRLERRFFLKSEMKIVKEWSPLTREFEDVK